METHAKHILMTLVFINIKKKIKLMLSKYLFKLEFGCVKFRSYVITCIKLPHNM